MDCDWTIWSHDLSFLSLQPISRPDTRTGQGQASGLEWVPLSGWDAVVGHNYIHSQMRLQRAEAVEGEIELSTPRPHRTEEMKSFHHS